MTTRDKTREKLLGSMRKTKEVIDDQPDSKQVHADTYARPAAKPAKKTPPSAKAKDVSGDASRQAAEVEDPYQSAGRIWPD